MEALVCWLSNETFQTKSFQISGSQSGAQRPSDVLGGFKGGTHEAKREIIYVHHNSICKQHSDRLYGPVQPWSLISSREICGEKGVHRYASFHPC